MGARYARVRGTHDILPDEVGAWQRVEREARECFGRYGFREIRTPVLEPTELFSRAVGASTDIVGKEMYTLRSGEESVTLRPENTAPVVRAFVEHALHRGVAAGYPERLYYIGPMFRRERPQKGRQRQFHQIGVEVLGSNEPLADAETLQMLWAFLVGLGVESPRLLLNSVGDATCRDPYRERLRAWVAPHLPAMCEDCRRRHDTNPLRMFDCKEEHDREVMGGAPLLADHLCGPCRDHLQAVRRYLDRFRVPYHLDPRLVRGLDYYVRTVFEVTAGGLGAQSALLGGGRYDGLVEELGGPPTPGFGFALGMERLLLAVPGGVAGGSAPDVAVVSLGAAAWDRGIDVAARLRGAGLRVLAPIAERPLNAQFKRAERLDAAHLLYVSDDAPDRYNLRDRRTGGERQGLSLDEVLAALHARRAPGSPDAP